MKQKNNQHIGSDQIKMDLYLVLISVACGMLNFYGFLLFLFNDINWQSFLVIHLALFVFILGFYPFFLRKKQEVYRDYIFLLIFFMASGFMGSLSYVIYIGVVFYMNKNASHLEAIYEELFPERDISESTKIYENILTNRDKKAEERDIVSFRDTLLFGTLSQKQNVIAAIVDDYNYLFASILIMASKDNIAAVRTSAATAISGIIDKYLQKQIILKAAVEEDETDIELLVKYANFLDEYAYCGLLDKSRYKEILSQAAEINIKIYNLIPTEVLIIHKIIRSFVRLGEYKKAKNWIDVYKKTSDSEISVIEDWNIETLYNLGEFDELRLAANKRIAKAKKSSRNLPKEYIEALELWGTPENA